MNEPHILVVNLARCSVTDVKDAGDSFRENLLDDDIMISSGNVGSSHKEFSL